MFLIASSTITGAEIVCRDWKATPLGSIDQWPMRLRSTVADAGVPDAEVSRLSLEMSCFYNDAYHQILGLRLPPAPMIVRLIDEAIPGDIFAPSLAVRTGVGNMLRWCF